MQIGTGLFTCQRRPDDDRPFEAIYGEMLRLGEAIDEAGLASAWVSEHHFAEDGYLPGTMPSLAALSARTRGIELGTCIALAPLYDAIRLAEDGATVDLLSGGRFTAGLSIGYRDREFEAFGVPKGERAARTADAVRTLRAAWSEGPLGYDPEFHPAGPDVTVTPKPESEVPIVLGGAAKPAVRRAARLADGWVAPSSLSVEGVRKRVADVERVREAEGLDGPFRIYVVQHGFVGDSPADAWERVAAGRRYLDRVYASWYEGEPVEELPAERRRELREAAILGTPEDVIAGLEPYREALAPHCEALGAELHFVLRTYYPGVDADATVEAIEALGEEVVPHFAED